MFLRTGRLKTQYHRLTGQEAQDEQEEPPSKSRLADLFLILSVLLNIGLSVFIVTLLSKYRRLYAPFQLYCGLSHISIRKYV